MQFAVKRSSLVLLSGMLILLMGEPRAVGISLHEVAETSEMKMQLALMCLCDYANEPSRFNRDHIERILQAEVAESVLTAFDAAALAWNQALRTQPSKP
jgi:hypothetical protein